MFFRNTKTSPPSMVYMDLANDLGRKTAIELRELHTFFSVADEVYRTSGLCTLKTGKNAWCNRWWIGYLALEINAPRVAVRRSIQKCLHSRAGLRSEGDSPAMSKAGYRTRDNAKSLPKTL